MSPKPTKHLGFYIFSTVAPYSHLHLCDLCLLLFCHSYSRIFKSSMMLCPVVERSLVPLDLEMVSLLKYHYLDPCGKHCVHAPFLCSLLDRTKFLNWILPGSLERAGVAKLLQTLTLDWSQNPSVLYFPPPRGSMLLFFEVSV